MFRIWAQVEGEGVFLKLLHDFPVFLQISLEVARNVEDWLVVLLHMPNQVCFIRTVPSICLLGKDHKLGSEISLSQGKKLLCLEGKGCLIGSGQAQILGREEGTSPTGLGIRTTKYPHLPQDSGEPQDVCLLVLKPRELRQPRIGWLASHPGVEHCVSTQQADCLWASRVFQSRSCRC